MRPAESQAHLAALRHDLVAAIAVDLQHAPEARQMRDRHREHAVPVLLRPAARQGPHRSLGLVAGGHRGRSRRSRADGIELEIEGVVVRVGFGASEQAITAVIRALNASTTAGTNLAEAAFSARRAFPAPPEQLLRREAMPTRHLGHHGARDQRLFENAGLVVRRPPPPATSTVDHLNAALRPLRLKRKAQIQTRIVSLRARLWSRNGRDWSAEFVAIAAAMRLPFAACSTARR